VEDSNKHITVETVHQVGYLPEFVTRYHTMILIFMFFFKYTKNQTIPSYKCS